MKHIQKWLAVIIVLMCTPSFADNANDPFREVAAKYLAANPKPQFPEEARKYKVQAEFAVQEKQFTKAVEFYGKALDIAPWWPEGHFNRALILGETKKYWDAMREMKRYLLLAPDATNARSAQDKIYQWEGIAGPEQEIGKVFKDCTDCPVMVILPEGSVDLVSAASKDTAGASWNLLKSPVAAVVDVLIKPADAGLGLFRDPEAKNTAHRITIPKPIAMGKFEVTQAEWRAVMGSNPPELKFTNCGDTCPVENVSWNDVQEFIQKLNAKTGKQYRLPTEAEWEYACYGGVQSEYCGGNDLDAVGWADSPFSGKTHPAGQKQANGYGLYDMTGNVWEWTNDCWEGDCTERVRRGGAWEADPQQSRAAYRYGASSARRGYAFGFRLAKTLP
jgi:formylglycine-generating enzyme required for sulfatase activity